MIKYTGHDITFKGIEHHLGLPERLHLIYSKESVAYLEVNIEGETMEIVYQRRLGGMLKPNAGISGKKYFTLTNKKIVRTFKINNLLS